MRIKVGCCGFCIGMDKYFSEYDVVEIQRTFYELLNEETLKNWRKKAPTRFEFTIKVFQGITHDVSSPTWRRSNIKNYKELKGKVGFLRPTKEVFEFWNKMLDYAKILKSKVLLIQLPSNFKDTEKNIENAENFFSNINRDNVFIAIELRGWREENIRRLCEKYDLIDTTDPLKREPTYYNRIAYFRLHGRYEGNKIIYNHKYSREELEKLKEKIFKYNAEECYVMFNNVYMRDNSKEFKLLIKK